MGKEIVIEESNKMPGEQSRLWKHEDIIQVLRNDLGTGKVEAISLHLQDENEKVEISSTAFKQMHNVRFFQITNFVNYPENSMLLLPNGLEFLPADLRYLSWDLYPLSYLPSNFCPENLVALGMRHSKLKELWNMDKLPPSLEALDATDCTSLESVSTVVLPKHELLLRNCIKLKQEARSTITDDVLESYLYDNEDKNGFCELSVAGSEVPQSIKYKNNNGSSLSVTLDCHDLIG
ncbi:hypothetical protein RCOM_0724240 [Ricinus communis]|uniref:Uncharacterized protein n=1 Tax=Ricinus communis TaxID=3988 RepID=B9SFW7_RICCO|nr:hypothetical protein RCOM_0724240 [Ricinus communis]